jgi:hypothetical protein
MISICLDTNAFHNNWLARGEAFRLLADFIAKKEARIYVSEITVQEHSAHYRQQAQGIAQKAKTSLNDFSNLLLKGKVPILPALQDTATFEPAFRERLEELGIDIVPIPPVNHTTLVARDLEHVKPFDNNGKGYRDALLWLGVLNAINATTTNFFFVTSNANDFCKSDKSTPKELHLDLAKELQQRAPGCTAAVYASPGELVEHIVKPHLKAIAEDEAATQELLKRIQSDTYEHFILADVVTNGLDTFSGLEATGSFLVDGTPLEEPIWVTMLEAAQNLEATAVFRLADDRYVCEGTAEASATLEGFLDRFEAFNQAELGNVHITDPDWNDHYAEVEVANAPAIIAFSFEFDPAAGDISSFEIIKIESPF